MATKTRKSATAAAVAALIAAASFLGIVARSPNVTATYSVTDPRNHGFSGPCVSSTFVQAPFFNMGSYTWNRGALMPLLAAEETARVAGTSQEYKTIRLDMAEHKGHESGIAATIDFLASRKTDGPYVIVSADGPGPQRTKAESLKLLRNRLKAAEPRAFFDWHPDTGPQFRVRKMTPVAPFLPHTFSGSYNCRAVVGSSTWSHHAWALAVDFDAPENCLGCPVASSEIGKHPAFVKAFTRYGFVWGGDFGSRPDAMHFEYDGPPLPVMPTMTLLGQPDPGNRLCIALHDVGLPADCTNQLYDQRDLKGVLAFKVANDLFRVEPVKSRVGPATWTLLLLAKHPVSPVKGA